MSVRIAALLPHRPTREESDDELASSRTNARRDLVRFHCQGRDGGRRCQPSQAQGDAAAGGTASQDHSTWRRNKIGSVHSSPCGGRSAGEHGGCCPPGTAISPLAPFPPPGAATTSPFPCARA